MATTNVYSSGSDSDTRSAIDLHHLHFYGRPAPLRHTCTTCGTEDHESEEAAAACCEIDDYAFEVVQVTQQWIDQGERREPDACPIALALANWNHHSWTVAPGTAYDGDDEWYMDGAVEDWIVEFDNGDLVHPIGLVMDTEGLTPTIRLFTPTEEKHG